jgi:hypothetical protein
MGGRVARRWPANAIVVRRAIFLALDGRADEARALLAAALHAFPQRHEATVLLLDQALDEDPKAIAPLLVEAEQARRRIREMR